MPLSLKIDMVAIEQTQWITLELVAMDKRSCLTGVVEARSDARPWEFGRAAKAPRPGEALTSPGN